MKGADSVLSFDGVLKNFGTHHVLQNVSFQVQGGEIVSLLGVNGAGKTTIIRLLTGLLKPNAGTVLLMGNDPMNYPSRQHVGVTPQNVDFPEGIKVREVLQFIQSHYKNPYEINKMVELFNLADCLEKKSAKLSGGQKRKLALALAFIGNPSLVFLDEPTVGLDVGSRKLLWEIIKAEAKKGKTIFLTTHYLNEIQNTVSRVLFLQKGQIRVDGSVSDVMALVEPSLVRVSFKYSQHSDFSQFPFCQKASWAEGVWTLETSQPDLLVRELVKKDILFEDLSIVRDDLEDAFLQLSHLN